MKIIPFYQRVSIIRLTQFLFVFFILFITLMPFLSIMTTNAQHESSQVYIVSINPDGSAVWSYEQHFIFQTIVERDAWLEQVNSETFDFPGFENFQQDMVYFAFKAGEVSGRSMELKNFTCGIRLEDTISYSVGIMVFNFSWIGFAKIQGDNILVGDAFDGLLLPSRTTMVLRYPDGWKVSDIKPSVYLMTGNEIVWFGLLTFESGQPSVILSSPSSIVLTSFIVIGLVSIPLLVIVPIFLLYPIFKIKPINMKHIQILLMLQQNGNIMYQQEIVKKTGWSNAKVSLAINDLIKNKKIKKEKKGRMNIIQLKK